MAYETILLCNPPFVNTIKKLPAPVLERGKTTSCQSSLRLLDGSRDAAEPNASVPMGMLANRHFACVFAILAPEEESIAVVLLSSVTVLVRERRIGLVDGRQRNRVNGN